MNKPAIFLSLDGMTMNPSIHPPAVHKIRSVFMIIMVIKEALLAASYKSHQK
jgi:hypothetical protein